MSSTITSENLQKIFSFPFKGTEWKPKLAIGSLLYMLSIFILPYFFIAGYSYEVMRQIIVDKSDPSMPEWDDFGKYFRDGLKLFGVSALYGSPALISSLTSTSVISQNSTSSPSSRETPLVLTTFFARN